MRLMSMFPKRKYIDTNVELIREYLSIVLRVTDQRHVVFDITIQIVMKNTKKSLVNIQFVFYVFFENLLRSWHLSNPPPQKNQSNQLKRNT